MKTATKPVVYRRSRRWLLDAVIAAGLFALIASTIHGDHASSLELSVFRFINGLPAFFVVLLWPAMQLGNMFVIPLGAAAAAIMRRFRLALAFLLVGGAKTIAAQLIKAEIIRHRPAVFFEDVHIRIGSAKTGLGFVSGHAIIAIAIAAIVHPYLPTRVSRVVLWTVAAFVLVGRVYVGAHLPLDVIAGGAVGFGIGSVVNLIVGTPRERTDAAKELPEVQ